MSLVTSKPDLRERDARGTEMLVGFTRRMKMMSVRERKRAVKVRGSGDFDPVEGSLKL